MIEGILVTGTVPETPPPRVVNKPWGWEAWFAYTDRYCGKRIFVRAGARLSLQYHERKVKTMLVEDGEGVLEINGILIHFSKGMIQHIPAGTLYRLTATTDLMVTEVSTPETDDVVRVEDDHGREGTTLAEWAPGGDPGREGGSGRHNKPGGSNATG